jgi:hypothetical protein
MNDTLHKEDMGITVDDSLFDTSTEDEPLLEDTSEPLDEKGVLWNYLSVLVKKLQVEVESKNQPEVYRNGSFWIRPQDPIFALETARKSGSGINPRVLYHPNVFIWILGLKVKLPGEPDYLKCPKCTSHLQRRGMKPHLI